MVNMAQEVFQSVHSTYKRGFLNTVKGKSKEQQRVLKAQREIAEGKLSRARAAAQVELAHNQDELVRSNNRLQSYRGQACTQPYFEKHPNQGLLTLPTSVGLLIEPALVMARTHGRWKCTYKHGLVEKFAPRRFQYM